MKYEVILHYFESSHLNQIYEGFARLDKSGICNVRFKKTIGNAQKPLLLAQINGKNVIYDTLDGLNWIDGKSLEENIQYFATNNFDIDYYFKRSFTEDLYPYINNRFQYYPLGLNYDIHSIYSPLSLNKIKEKILRNKITEYFFGKRYFVAEDFVQAPIINSESKILFLVRLWDPTPYRGSYLYDEWMQLNMKRIAYVKKCREKYGEQFIGGIKQDEFSMKMCSPDLILPETMTRKQRFLEEVKKSNICIATTGLHNSIGWKFAEYVAASRAIVTEPLNYRLPGNIAEESNYLEFIDEESLIKSIDRLLSDRTLLLKMMRCNHNYYLNNMQPDKLILNTLLKIQ